MAKQYIITIYIFIIEWNTAGNIVLKPFLTFKNRASYI